MTAIYSLRHPTSGRVHYIGKTDGTLRERLRRHIKDAGCKRAKHTKKSRWIAKCLRQGRKPVISLIEVVPAGESWEEYEALWIRKFRTLNAERMLNATDGGQGPSGQKMSEEAKRKLSAHFKGRPNMAIRGHVVTEEMRQRISKSLIGRKSTRQNYKHSAETLKKISDAHKGKPLAPSTIEQLRLVHRGRKASAEARKNMSEASKKRVKTESGRQQLLAASKNGLAMAHLSPRVGYRHSAETKRKLSDAAMRRPVKIGGRAHKQRLRLSIMAMA